METMLSSTSPFQRGHETRQTAAARRPLSHLSQQGGAWCLGSGEKLLLASHPLDRGDFTALYSVALEHLCFALLYSTSCTEAGPDDQPTFPGCLLYSLVFEVDEQPDVSLLGCVWLKRLFCQRV